MKRFIDVDAFLDEMKYVFNDMSADVNLLTVKNRLETMDGADVAEVVRCKDCKNYHKYLTIGGFFRCECVLNEECVTSVHEMHFCSYGERKDA